MSDQLAVLDEGQLVERNRQYLKQKNKLVFLGASTFLDVFTFTQTLYIGGRPGGGKTHLAVTLAAWLQVNGYVDSIISNIPMAIRVPVSVPVFRQAIILDESWIYLSDKTSVFRYAGFVRKDECYLLLPAVYPVHRLLMRFTVERVFNCYSVGVPAWLYQWRYDRLSAKEKGLFLVYHPDVMFGVFDTKAKPKSDGGIVKAIAETSDNILEGEVEGDYPDSDRALLDALEDVLDATDESTKGVQDAVIQIKKIRSRK